MLPRLPSTARALPLVLLAAPAGAVQAPGVVDYDPTPPPDATWPVFVDDAPGLAGPGTVIDDTGTGRGQAWIDVVGPDPSDPEDPAAIGPPDGILDLIVTNSDSPALPLGASEEEWVNPPVAEVSHPCVVYRGAADGTLTDVTALMSPGEEDGFGLAYPGGSPWGVVGGDYDGDGDQDLFYPCGAFNMLSKNALMRSNGDGTFANVTEAAGLVEEQASFGGTWFDYDRDGDLDLFVTNAGKMFAAGFQGPEYPDPTDRLYRNEDGLGFTEVGHEASVDLKSNSFTTAVSDLDRDGWLDVVVSCFRQYNKVFYNDWDGTFTFMAPRHNDDFDLVLDELVVFNPEQPGPLDFLEIPREWDVLPVEGILSIPVELQDFNGDGWTDILYGNWSVQIPDGEPTSGLGAFFEPFDRAYLYLNRGDEDGNGLGDGTFREAAVELGIGHVGGVMGMLSADFNGDGYLDVFMGGGGPDLAAHLEEDYLYVNNGAAWPADFQRDPDQPLSQVFYEVGALAGTYDNINMAHGVAARRAGSGRLDMMVANGGPAFFGGGQPNFYFENTGNEDGSQPRYLAVELEAVASAPGAYGARVDVVRDGDLGTAQWAVQERRSGFGFSSHDDGPLTFGLGDGGALAVGVRWPSGVRQGRLLWPAETGVDEVTLVEGTLSLGFDVAYPDGGGVALALSIEETGAAPSEVQLLLLTLPALGGGAFGPPVVTPVGPPITLVPGAPLELDGTAAALPEGFYSLVALDAATLAIRNAGSVWHDPVLQSGTAPALPVGPAAPRASTAASETALPHELLSVHRRVSFAADALLVAPARAPLAWERHSLAGAGSLVLADGSQAAWRDGAVEIVPANPGEAMLSFNGPAPTLSLGRPLRCCRVRGPAAGVFVRAEGLSGGFAVDGRELDGKGLRVAPGAPR